MATQREAKRAAALNAAALSRYPNVIGIGTGPLHHGPGELAAKGGHAVTIYVTRKCSEHEIPADQRLPRFVEIRGRGGTVQVPVRVVESGVFRPEHDSDQMRFEAE